MDNTKEQAIDVAKALSVEHSWPWLEPVEVVQTLTSDGEKAWNLRTNIQARGRSIRILIRQSDLMVIESSYLPR